METPLLDQIHSPADLKKLDESQLEPLCEEIRGFLLESVSKTGGHLSSNLGAIELTIALHRVLSTPQDKLVFDVGHQCYTHKLLTGRKDRFSSLRQLDGISGFPNPRESEHDSFIAGHGNTALSLAIGMAHAKKIKHEPGKAVAIIGDGAFTGGMVYEGLNNIEHLNNLVVILNDNKMSISKNVGAMAQYLTRLRTDPAYFRAKAHVQSVLDAIPLLGEPTREGLQTLKRWVRRLIYHSTLFEEMGFQYIGPVDGHNVKELTEMFTHLQHQSAPLFIHVVTTKGKGYRPAEKNPGEFHGVSSFVPDGMDPDNSPGESFSVAFGKHLCALAYQDHNICAITAAMKYGTGLQYFYRRFPHRFFDVGMAEQHAVTFAAGLASEGMRPVVAIYSTFLQRSYDQIIHDVKLLNENVLFAIDRAGLVPGDGETHQGIYDPAFLSQIGIATWSPANYAELEFCMSQCLLELNGPCAIRYPRGAEASVLKELPCTGNAFDCIAQNEGAKIVLVSYGSQAEDTLLACQKLNEQGVVCDCYKLLQIWPLPVELTQQLMGYDTILFAEECVQTGGIGEHLNNLLRQEKWQGTYLHCAVDPKLVTHATVPQLKKIMKLDADSLTAQIKENLS